MMMEGGDEELTTMTSSQWNNNNNNNNRRFSDEQIRSLESMFKVETKLEPMKKQELATELGLQPRQVAIWFQNRRARWKSKQIEHDYRLLKSDYHNLSSRFHSLNQEKLSLLNQLQQLRDKLKDEENNAGRGSKEMKGNYSSDESDSGYGKRICEFKENPDIYSDNDNHLKIRRYPVAGEEEVTNLSENADLSELVPSERSCNFEFGGLFDDHSSGGTLNWWDFST